MKGYFYYDIDTVCRIDELGSQFCDLLKLDPKQPRDIFDQGSLGSQIQ